MDGRAIAYSERKFTFANKTSTKTDEQNKFENNNKIRKIRLI